MQKIQNYIDGELNDSLSRNYIDNYNPSEGSVYSLIPDSDERDVQLAAKAAVRAFPVWSAMPVAERAALLMKIADLIERDHNLLAKAECIDNGKPLSLARSVDIPRASSNMRFFASAVLHFSSESHLTDDKAINYTTRKPVGVAGCISPWNLPLYLFTWKIAPALAAGNTVVAKPSEVTPMTAYLFSKICIEAGLPAGVLNIVHGLGAKVGQAIVAHPDIPLISFTGGTTTGKAIAAAAAPMFKKLSLELGGKNPNIIFDDCDLQNTIEVSLRSSFSNQGQICLCGSRILVQSGIYNQFLKQFVDRVAALKVGDPMESGSDIGAVVSQAHMNKVLAYIDLARKEGGEIQCGGQQVKVSGRCEKGYFIAPTVITGLDYTCKVNQEEIFGPVVTVMPFDSEEEVVNYANSTVYGLSATIFTDSLKRAHRVADELKCGIVWVNCWLLRDLRTPFGGVKQSGVGREGGEEALRFFTEAKNVCVSLK
ncbi:aldehyde dehydrogenase [Fulvivirga sediminis]|uniref:Aldehyde dehydrogenase n=1 Tax=Fulvivirga sediminis TaxID=2803949 RepID=A0A937F996_9BACT|nr:aldehyde dehydrogenase [Fulvivirga sediminis]MBL3656969.1 aldehyde dehydrogenase [Fulvivirga sediminis]